jgi:hypothetical protein
MNTKAMAYGNDIIFPEKQVHDWSYRLALPVFPDEKRRLFLCPKSPNDFRYYEQPCHDEFN